MELQTLFLIFLFCHIPFFVIFAVNETNYIKVFDIQIRHGVIKILVRVNFFFNSLKLVQQRLRKREEIEGEIVGIEVEALANAQLENIMKERISNL